MYGVDENLDSHYNATRCEASKKIVLQCAMIFNYSSHLGVVVNDSLADITVPPNVICIGFPAIQQNVCVRINTLVYDDVMLAKPSNSMITGRFRYVAANKYD